MAGAFTKTGTDSKRECGLVPERHPRNEEIALTIQPRTTIPFLLITALLFSCGTPQSTEDVAPASEPIVPADAKLEHLFTRTADIKGGLTEGPAVALDGSIYFSDIPFGKDKGMILRFDPKTGEIIVFTEDSYKSNGLAFDADGHLIAAEGSDYGGRQISRWDVETGERTTVADNYEGKKFNAPNDLVIDSQGRIYFSDPRYLGAETRDLDYFAIFRVDKDGTVVEVTREVSKPNGVALSPDEKTLYVADHDNGSEKVDDPTAPPATPGPMKVYAFPLGPDGLVSGERKTLVDFGDQSGCDGMTVDDKGNIYLTARRAERPGVLIINPAGEEVGLIPPVAPPQGDAGSEASLPSNVEFGIGDEANVLYVTADTSLYRIRLNATGHHPQHAQ